MGRLSDADANALRQAMASDEALRQAVNLRRLEFEVAEQIVGDDIRAKLSRYRAGNEPETRKIWEKWYFWLILTCVFIVLAWLWFSADKAGSKQTPELIPEPVRKDTIVNEKLQDQTPEHGVTTTTPNAESANKRLANAYYAQTNTSMLSGLRTNNTANSLETALTAWENNQWTTVLNITQKIAPSDPQFEKAKMLEGNALMKLGRYKQARKLFSALMVNENGAYYEDAQWLALLAQLATLPKINKEFQQELQGIAQDANHTHNKLALELKAALERK